VKKWLLAVCLLSATFNNGFFGFAQSVQSTQSTQNTQSGQSMFTYSVKKDIILGSAALAIGLAPFVIHNEPDHFPGKQGREDVNPFDRPLMFSYNKPLDMVSDYGVYGMLLLPALSLVPNIGSPGTLLTYGIMYAQAFAFTAGTKNLLKNAIIRYRPYMYADGVPAGKDDDYHNSFPSGSTAYAFLSAGFLSATYACEFPESRWKIPVIAGSYTLAAGVASMRILSGSHFLSDVLAGAAIGTLYGWLIPALHKRQTSDRNFAILLPGNGIIVSVKL
jgi:undecaprenyl-diphosphatase